MKISFYFLTIATLFSAFLLQVSTANAQVEECGTDQYYLEWRAQNPEEAKQRDIYESQVRQLVAERENGNDANRQQQQLRIIPVVVHAITETGAGGLTREQIIEGIRLINDDFRKLNSDTTAIRAIFDPHAADSEIEFRLARIDPQGNCTDGIVRIASPLATNAQPSNAVKSLSYWPANRYLNIWLVNSITNSSGGGLNGYAQFPGSGSLQNYGVVMRFSRFGLDASGANVRTATHEIGHCLNLYHTFQGNCGTSCATSGDEVCDTPPTNVNVYSCSLTQNSCSNDNLGFGSPFSTDMPDQTENYMSYGDCRCMFSTGQKNRMIASLDTYPFLQNLTSAQNIIATGVENPLPACAPVAFFNANPLRVCEGASIMYADNSFNAGVDSTWAWSWSFPGGTPATSTDQNPVIHYSNAGIYPATLTVSSSGGADTFTRSGYIKVLPLAGDTAPFTQDFEHQQFPLHPTDPAKSWDMEGDASFGWARYSGAGATGSSSSIRVQTNHLTSGEPAYLYSPAIDASGTANYLLSFDVAYATSSPISADGLRVHFSADCGQTWSLRYAKTGQTLATNGGAYVNNFVPAPGHWRTETVNLPPLIANHAELRIRFEAIGGQGNPIYLDNVNLSGALSASEGIITPGIQLYPNPNTGSFTLEMQHVQEPQITAELRNVLGQVVWRELLTASNGSLLKQVQTEGLSSGIYQLMLHTKNGRWVKKMVVEN